MSKPSYGPAPTTQVDAFYAFLESTAKLLMWAGLAVSLIAIGLLVFTYTTFSGNASASPDQALSNIDLLQKALLAGGLAAMVGTTFLFWGEETLGAFQIIGTALLYFSPLFLPGFMGSGTVPNEVSGAALGALQTGGMVCGMVAIAVTVIDVANRVSVRVRQGSKADQIKYGKGAKEEKDIRNVFMGRCWQLPYCRKFVRERCPIYHSQRTCWKERVGCMCEEQVIRDAMQGKVIPKDSVAAAKFIPYNNQLTLPQKQERCRQCVIYNEHQKHKYKLILPVTMGVFGLVYVAAHGPLIAMTGSLMRGLDTMVGRFTFGSSGNIEQQTRSGLLPFQEIFLACLLLVAFTYALKLIEYLIFKLKV
jgi:hypothetical protein